MPACYSYLAKALDLSTVLNFLVGAVPTFTMSSSTASVDFPFRIRSVFLSFRVRSNMPCSQLSNEK